MRYLWMHVRVSLMTILILLIGIGGCSSADEGWTGPNGDSSPDSYQGDADEPSLIGGEYGWIQIDSVPQGAFVEVDGTGQGTTPVSVQVSCTGTPSHHIRVTHPGYQEWTGHVSGNPEPGETIFQTAYLVPVTQEPTPEPTITVIPTPIGGDYGWIQVESVPQGAFVEVDGTGQGTTPVSVQVSCTGTPSHHIRVTHPGYQEWTGHVSGNPEPGETIYQTAYLVPVTQEPTPEPTITVIPTPIGGDYGWIQIDSVPQGAFVEVDGTGQGTTPVSVQVSCTGTPSHHIRVTHPGYQEWTGHVSGNPEPGETIFQTAYLVPVTQEPTPEPTITVIPTQIGGDYGWFKIESNPSGADVTFDSSYQGTTPVLVRVLVTATPSHDLKIRRNGYHEYFQRITYNPGRDETIPIMASLVPLSPYGSITVTSDPSGALATLDAGQQYLTPCSFPQVVTGMHTITVYREGYLPYTARVQVEQNSHPRIHASLSRAQMTGTLDLNSVPEGADVKIDNLWQGQTPQRIGNLAAGTHTLSLRLAGYQTVIREVLINSGQETRVRQVLEKVSPDARTGSLMVSTTPAGASVYLNGDYQGTTPVSGALDLTDLDPGIYTLLLTAKNREDLSTPVTVAAGRITPVNVELKPAPTPAGMNGTLSISSVPAGAQILLDNRFVGYTPIILPSVGPGEYSLVLMMEGYENYSNRVQIAAGMTTTASINLTPAPPDTPTPEPVPSQAEPTARSPLPLSLVPAGLAAALLLYRFGRQD